MKFKEKLDRIFDVKSYGYKVNKWILRSAFILMILLFGLIGVVDGVDTLRGSVWIECPENAVGGRCMNPYAPMICGSEPVPMGDDVFMYNNFVDCDYSYLEAGETYGVKPSWLARSFSWICVLLFVVGLLLNHFIYNKNFRVKKNVEMD